MADNNVKAYQELVDSSQQALRVLKLDFDNLQQQNDIVLHKLDSVRNELKIKPKQINTAATQTQSLIVNKQKETGDQIVVKDTTYTDSIKYNDLTTVYYTITNDSIDIGLNIQNEQYLFIHRHRQYKNKKSFFKRLFTFDFKKETVYKYDIVNTNDLIQTKDIRVIESIEK